MQQGYMRRIKENTKVKVSWSAEKQNEKTRETKEMIRILLLWFGRSRPFFLFLYPRP